MICISFTDDLTFFNLHQPPINKTLQQKQLEPMYFQLQIQQLFQRNLKLHQQRFLQ